MKISGEKYVTKSAVETATFAKKWVEGLVPEEISGSATIIALNGNLGSGKTTFTQAVARELGVVEQVTSPTFVIQKVYEIKNEEFLAKKMPLTRLVHIDAYRLEDASELETIGFLAIAADPKNLILIEWPERVAELLPKNTRNIYFTFVDENTREIVVQ